MIDMDKRTITADFSIHEARAMRTGVRFQRRKIERQRKNRDPFLPDVGKLDVDQMRIAMLSALEIYLNDLIDEAIKEAE